VDNVQMKGAGNLIFYFTLVVPQHLKNKALRRITWK
jgi:hypothetical protein